MADVQTVEGEFAVPQDDGQKLYTKTWKAVGETKAILVFIHGFSDHCNAYFNLFPSLAHKGIEVRSFDQRGWGRSVKKPADKGLTGPTTQVLSDISAFVATCLPAPAPVFLMGHSMGGGEVLHWLGDAHPAAASRALRTQLRGYLLESPFIAFNPASKPNFLTVAAGRLAGKLLPRRQMVNALDAKLLSRSVETQRAFVEDPLCHDTGTLEGLAGLLDRAAALDGGKVEIPADAGEGGQTRIWLAHGTIDGVCDYHGTQRFFGRLANVKDKELKTYQGWSHKLHAEPSPDAETFAADVAAWILARSGPLQGAVRSRL